MTVRLPLPSLSFLDVFGGQIEVDRLSERGTGVSFERLPENFSELPEFSRLPSIGYLFFFLTIRDSIEKL